ncbi:MULTISPECIES: hypothetical protein [Parachlamydia]|jgi:hypothetical protein|uniref:Uncharacterized protein n=2 Tax=Parachlamydia acanthamoebae TaxID=83552 RepID=F8KVG5_PARAV|nr:hypothetical protein [Parachlamydia acanthamoebae]EFB42002.1 hypothetical protein pah_c016o033 [Parachlamydia acanthamoebae str. Hall's coccus]CCB87695.1 putative uncharacterized protein [Parachlamydia acanthamoebae UV-7]
MQNYTMVMFGEAEKGEFRTAYYCKTLSHLVDYFGNPPPESRGLHFAVQALLYQRDLVFFRVKEEGFSFQDYIEGLHLLENQRSIEQIDAIGIPGVGDSEIIHALTPLCKIYHSILVLTEADLCDYLLDSPTSRA